MKQKKRIVRKLESCLLAFVMVFGTLTGIVPGMSITAKADDNITNLIAALDSTATYGPTMLKDGSFEELTSISSGWTAVKNANVNGNYNGTGWGTTDEAIEVGYDGPGVYGVQKPTVGKYFCEMNYNKNAILYQDLTTCPGDIIMWTLQHAARNISDEQSMKVWVGGSDGSYPSGTGNTITATANAHIKEDSLAEFSSAGVSNPAGTILGYAKDSDLSDLKLSRDGTKQNPWKTARGVYIIPQNQTTTRFAFASISPTNGVGNMLDNITFATLLGNVSAVRNDDQSVTIRGYWGDEDASKKLMIKIIDTVHEVDMSSVVGKNFTINLPAEMVKDVDEITIYHPDYERVVYEIVRGDNGELVCRLHQHAFTFTVDGPTITATCTSTCPLPEHKASLTISATEEGAVLAGDKDVFSPIPEISYYYANDDGTRGEALPSPAVAPKAPGKYWAEFTLGDKTAHIVYGIYSVTFNANGHGTTPDVKTVFEGNKVVKPSISENGYVFGGWYKEPAFENAWDFDNDVVTSDITLYAKWTRIKAVVTKAPVAIEELYNTGSETKNMKLVTAGEAKNGTVQYALGTDENNKPTDGWGDAIPEEKDAGTYYVWYKAFGTDGAEDSEAACISVRIYNKTISEIPGGGTREEIKDENETTIETIDRHVPTTNPDNPEDEDYFKDTNTGSDGTTEEILYKDNTPDNPNDDENNTIIKKTVTSTDDEGTTTKKETTYDEDGNKTGSTETTTSQDGKETVVEKKDKDDKTTEKETTKKNDDGSTTVISEEYSDGQPTGDKTETTTKDGKTTDKKTTKKNSDGSTTVTDEDFDENGNKTGSTETTTSQDGKETVVEKKDKDDKTTEKETTRKNDDGSTTVISEEYSDGQPTGDKTETTTKDGKTTDKKTTKKNPDGSTTVTDEDFDENGNKTGSTETTYDTNGNIIKTVKKDAAGNVIPDKKEDDEKGSDQKEDDKKADDNKGSDNKENDTKIDETLETSKKTTDEKLDIVASELKKVVDSLTGISAEKKEEIKKQIDKTIADTKTGVDSSTTADAVVEAYQKGLVATKVTLKDAIKTDVDNQITVAKKIIDNTDGLTSNQKKTIKASVDADVKKVIDDLDSTVDKIVDNAAKGTSTATTPTKENVVLVNEVMNKAANIAKEAKTDAKVEVASNKYATPEKVKKNELNINMKLSVDQVGRKINIKWGKVKNADGYQVFVQYCGKKFSKKAAKTIKKNSITKCTITKINGKKLNLKKNYKIYVIAYKNVSGRKLNLCKSLTAHIVGVNNKSHTNVKAIRITNHTIIDVKKGSTHTIKAKTLLVNKSKKQLSDAHAKEFRYASADPKIATVNSKGVIKGIKEGTTIIYVYARNGYAKEIKVTVVK